MTIDVELLFLHEEEKANPKSIFFNIWIRNQKYVCKGKYFNLFSQINPKKSKDKPNPI